MDTKWIRVDLLPVVESVSVTENTDLRSPKISLNQASNIIHTHQNFQKTIDLYRKISFKADKYLIGRQIRVSSYGRQNLSRIRRPEPGQLVSISGTPSKKPFLMLIFVILCSQYIKFEKKSQVHCICSLLFF